MAEFSGVNVVPIMIATYVICSIAAAIAGILYTGFVAQPYLGLAWATRTSSPRSRPWRSAARR